MQLKTATALSRCVWKSLDYPNLAKLYEVYDHEDRYLLIMELC